jgi:Sel1 repeat-containing protein
MYELGEGVAQDSAEAVRWYARAADQALPVAQFDLAYMYATGKGVPADAERAVRLYEPSAVSVPVARFNLASLYLAGSGRVGKDPIIAYKWGLLAVSAEFQRILHDPTVTKDKEARLGHAILLVQHISKNLSKKDKKTGRRLAEEWLNANAAHLGAEPQDFAEAIRDLK